MLERKEPISSYDPYLNRARVRMNYYQKDWPEWREVKRLEGVRPVTVDDIRNHVQALKEANARLKAKREVELKRILAQVEADDGLRGAIPTSLRNQIRAKWKRRRERELFVRHRLWNKETLDLLDEIEDGEAFYDAEQARIKQWEEEVKPEIIAKYDEEMNNEIKHRAGMNPDWTDAWYEDKQEDLRLLERSLKIVAY